MSLGLMPSSCEFEPASRISGTAPELSSGIKETLNKDEFLNFGDDGWLMTLQRPEKIRLAAWDDLSVWLDGGVGPPFSLFQPV
jgi:hypothetical protein